MVASTQKQFFIPCSIARCRRVPSAARTNRKSATIRFLHRLGRDRPDGLKPLQPELSRIAALASKDELTELLAHYQLINVTAFFNFGEQQDFKDSRNRSRLWTKAAWGSLSRFLLPHRRGRRKNRAQYVQHITTCSSSWANPRPLPLPMREDHGMETALAKVSMDITSQRDPKNIYHLMPVSQLAALAPAIAWDRFSSHRHSTRLRVERHNPDFFKGMNALLVATDLDNHQDVLACSLIHSPTAVLPKPFADEALISIGASWADNPKSEPVGSVCVQAPTER